MCAANDQSLKAGAPTPTLEVKAVFWGHRCRLQDYELKFMTWDESPFTEPANRLRGKLCSLGCGYRVDDDTVLFNNQWQAIETVSGVNRMPQRYAHWWMLCYQCMRWGANGLGGNNPLGIVTSKEVGQNCCDHCKATDLSSHTCNEFVGKRGGCMAYNKYGEIIKYMSSGDLPINSVKLRPP
ncbi:hypothetical protein QBC44DRAFT_369556 [Cladorrhinum sp. PSN332]|nr:hypothetical protein QBC44DRAFT_369556 [Cladorrhinum sp. PSN332]